MQRFDTNPFDGELEAIATLRDRVVMASFTQATVESELKSAIRSGLQSGMSIDELSDASGMTPDQIRKLETDIPSMA